MSNSNDQGKSSLAKSQQFVQPPIQKSESENQIINHHHINLNLQNEAVEEQKKEIKKLQAEISELREQLKIKDATIDEKNKRIDYLMNEEIARLNKIIEELKEEKKALLEQLDGLKKQVGDLSRQIIDMQEGKRLQDEKLKCLEDESIKMKEESSKMREASFISDLMSQLYYEFILCNKTDERFGIFIKSVKYGDTEMISDIDTKLFNQVIRKGEKLSEQLKAKFRQSVHEYYDANTKIYSEVVEGRNKFSHSRVRYIAQNKSNEEFLKYVEEEIKGMKFYQNEAVKLFQQIKYLLNPEQTQFGEKEIIDWIERSLGIVLSDGFRDLQDGIYLCGLLKHFYQDIDLQVKEKPMSPNKAKLNIQSFLFSAENIGIKQFEVSDLFELSNKSKVIESLMDLKSKIQDSENL